MAGVSRGLVLSGVGIVAVLSAQALPRAQTPAKAAAPVTFTRDVAPILFKNCASCHRAGEMAPMSLTTFTDARPWARAVKKAVVTRAMPPWGADPKFGEFANDPRLSEKDLATIVAWVDGGAIEGDARDLPPLPTFTRRLAHRHARRGAVDGGRRRRAGERPAPAGRLQDPDPFRRGQVRRAGRGHSG